MSSMSNGVTYGDAETARMIREEVFLRPARRAAVFCLLVLIALLMAIH